MAWSNERYVRIYTRDTAAMLLIEWDERALFWELLRRVDRAGVLQLDGFGAEGLAAHLRCPADVAARALAAWVRVGLLEDHGDKLLVPSHLDAQEARQSDTERQRASRERRRSTTRTLSHGVTACHTESRPVTRSHGESLQPSLAYPSLAEPESRESVGGESTVDSVCTRSSLSALSDATPEERHGAVPSQFDATATSRGAVLILAELRRYPALRAVATGEVANALDLAAAAIGLPLADAVVAIGDAGVKAVAALAAGRPWREPEARIVGYMQSAAKRRRSMREDDDEQPPVRNPPRLPPVDREAVRRAFAATRGGRSVGTGDES